MPSRIRRSIALKLVLASALPSAVVLVGGLGALVAHSHRVAEIDLALAFRELWQGAVLGTLLALTFAGMTIALAARHFLIKPIQALQQVMARAELGEFLVRARVQSEDELGRLARGFNTMLARITDMAAVDIEARESMAQMERELSLQAELKAVNAQLAAHLGETELLLEVSKALSGTLDLPEQLEVLGKEVCARLAVNEFSVMLLDARSQELVVEALAGDAPKEARGLHFKLGEGVTGEVAARGKTIYVTDVTRDARYLNYKVGRERAGSFLAVPLRSKGNVLGVMNFQRPRVDGFSLQDVRLAEAVAAQAALSIANARLYQQTLELSFTDPLTGVANRRQLLVRLEQEVSRSARFGEPLSLLMIDLDLFKRVNDAHGHAVGDGVLRGVALALAQNVRRIDVVARIGGDEFCVLLPRAAKHEALEVAEKLRRAVAAAELPGPQGQPPLFITSSAGVATLRVDADDAPGLMDRADAALFEAKRLGRDRVVQAEPARRASA
ncbi:MAG TPA: diguanylate cyclase [Myxococcales bacterium]